MQQTKQTIIQSGILDGFVDIHSHILCGVDDGADTARESEEMLVKFKSLGFKKCIVTPHIMAYMYNNKAHNLIEVFNKQMLPLSKRHNIEVALGAEYMMDDKLIDRLDSNEEILTIAPNHILVEMSMSSKREGWEQILSELNHSGYTPVLAHPERYHYFSEQDLRKIKSKGVLLQLNFLSLQGFYGKRVMDNARALIATGIYDLVASDVHYLSMISDIGNLYVDKNQLSELKILVKNNQSLG